MKVRELIEKLALKVSVEGNLDAEIKYGYSSDLLSDVMGNSKENSIWVTLQIHPNIVAVATMRDIPAILLVNGRDPEEETKRKAKENNISILSSKQGTFNLVGELFKMGLKGS